MPDATARLPPKPEPPKGYDCCGGGCADCDFRTYLRALADWQALAAGQSPSLAADPSA